MDAGVVAVIGHPIPGVSIEAAPIYAAKDIAQIAISTNPKFTQLGLNSTFRMVANDTRQARAIGSFAATQLSASRYAALDDGALRQRPDRWRRRPAQGRKQGSGGAQVV